MPANSTLALNKPLEISAGYTHALLQSGKLTHENERNLYETSCRFDIKSFGPLTIEPERFKIRRTDYGSVIASQGGLWEYFTEIRLDSDRSTDVIMLRCQQWGYNLHSQPSIQEIKTALGEYFTFTFPQSKSKQPDK